MQTQFPPEETDRFEETVRALVRLCTEWAASRRRPLPDEATIHNACDQRQHFTDGRYAHWTPSLLRELLLEWFPRHAVTAEGQWPLVVPSLRTWFDFLEDQGLLDPRGASVDELTAELDALAEPFLKAMAMSGPDSAPRLLAGTMLDRGVDPTDADSAQRYLDNVRDTRGGLDELRLTLASTRGLDQQDGGRYLTQPPVWLPAREELEAEAARSPVVRQLLLLHRWLGRDGRALTRTGRIRPVDAMEVAHRLRLREPALAEGQLRTSARLPRLNRLVDWARRVRVARTRHNRLMPVRAARRLHGDPFELFARALCALPRMQESICGPDLPKPRQAFFPDLVWLALSLMYGHPHAGVSREVMEESIWASYADRHGVDELDDDPTHVAFSRAGLLGDLHFLVDALFLMGAVERVRPEEGNQRLRLTAPAVAVVRELLIAEGRRAPLVGDLASADAHVLLYSLVEEYGPAEAREELELWLRERGAVTDLQATVVTDTPAALVARNELVQALRRTTLRTRKAGLLRMLTQCLPERADFPESLLDDRDLGPTALQALVEVKHRTMQSLDNNQRSLMIAESLAQVLELGGPTMLVRQFDGQDETMVQQVLTVIARSGHPHAERIRRSLERA
ncbi:hypothetical protein J4H86_08205 [Spiractinospora alimapuensis]|uniref:hypothetical protein n=1 Tax=Spiractinospora alimapuensis TaxID=2820884 RepID=UPI001F48E871|nr:hypothetical protein [Spiractinospora alimapuensis]QVQ53690.1 hypothetical protein J4H86_08205 [Spiractinospora alimapuensis]